MTPDVDDLWFLPLGGSGEIGMNMNLYGHAGKWLMVDCGVTFAKPDEDGPRVQMADPAFIVERRDDLLGLLITHAHEDHIGAVTHLWPQLQCPVFVTAFAAAILRRKLAEAGLVDRVPVTVVGPEHQHELGPFRVKWIGITHSTPESHGLLVQTSVGDVYHTGDWKLDAEPVVGEATPPQKLAAAAAGNVLAMVCDSTNALEPGWSASEGELREGLEQVVAQAEGRVIVGCFGSNVARLVTLARVAEATGRYAGLMGRSLHTYYAAAKESGVWPRELKLIDGPHLGFLPRDEVLAVATGSQGEARAALHRLSLDKHPDMELERGDTLIFSSRTIPGNEESVELLKDRLAMRGVRIVEDSRVNLPIHASGHPKRDELAALYAAVKPKIAIPVHGEDEHMAANAEVAQLSGVPRQLTGSNGDLYMLAPVPGVRRAAVATGRVGVDRGQLVPVVP